MSCQRCGSHCQGQHCQPCSREIARGIETNDDPYPTTRDMSQQTTDATTDASSQSDQEYPHQEQLADLAVSRRFVYRELEHADSPLSLQDISLRLRTPYSTIKSAASDLVECDLISKYPNIGDNRRTIYIVGDDQPNWDSEGEP